MMTRGARQLRYPAHEGPANAEDVNVHVPIQVRIRESEARL